MDMSFEDQVRERAYHLWLSGGMADGHEHEHWVMAEQAVKAAAPVVMITKPAAKTATRAVKGAAKPAAKAKTAKPAARKAPKSDAVVAH